MINLSVVIITLNEEKNIGRCIESVKKIADEIVVVDSFSTDKTKEIAVEKGAKFITNPFKGHIEQKNFALTVCTFDYILSLDADEELSPELVFSIEEIKNNWKFDGYYINRLSNYCGKWIKHGGWYPDRKLRLFQKLKGSWGGINPHDRFILKTKSIGFLKGNLLHHTINSIEEHVKQVNYFSSIAAQMAFNRGKRSNVVLIIMNPIFKFFRDYILKAGFLDGFYGFVISLISAHSKFLKYVKLRELQVRESSKNKDQIR